MRRTFEANGKGRSNCGRNWDETVKEIGKGVERIWK